MINLIVAPITYTKDKNILTTLNFEFNKDFEEIKEKHKESYLFKAPLQYGEVYFVVEDHGVLHIRLNVKSEHVYDDLVEILKVEYPNAALVKLIPVL
jgi:hypothetical protein